MLKVLCELESMGPVRFNKHLTAEGLPNETKEDYEKRVWQERGEYDDDDKLFLRSVKFRKCIQTAAQWMNIQIPGSGKATYTKHFKGGVIVMNSIAIDVHRGDVQGEWLFTAPRKNDGKRWVCFPVVKEWSGILQVNIIDEKITPEVFERVINFAGMGVGIGSYRPEVGGDYGRFEVISLDFETA